MAEGGPDDENLKQAIATVEAKKYKVLTTEEYEMLLSHTKDNKGTPAPNTSTPRVTEAPSATKPKLSFALPWFYTDPKTSVWWY